jgi:hypothetical protein
VAALARPSLAPSRSTAGFSLREFSHGAICLLPQVTAFAFADYNGENTWHAENSAHTHFSTGYLLAFLEDFGSLDAAALPAAQRQAAAAHPLLAVRRDMHTQPPGTTSTSSTSSTTSTTRLSSPAPPPTHIAPRPCAQASPLCALTHAEVPPFGAWQAVGRPSKASRLWFTARQAL